MRTDINVLGHLTKGASRIENVMLSIATVTKAGQMQTREGFKVGDQYRFEGIDGRNAQIRIRRINGGDTFFILKPESSVYYRCRMIKRKAIR
jgi:hypothetical protein